MIQEEPQWDVFITCSLSLSLNALSLQIFISGMEDTSGVFDTS